MLPSVEYADQLLHSIRNATKEYVSGGTVGVLFSGGLDSTIIARVASDYGHVMLYTIGTEGAHDLLTSQKTAVELGLKWSPIILDEKMIIANLLPLSRLLEDSSPLLLSYEMPLFIVASHAKENVLMMDDDLLAKGMKNDLENLLSHGIANERRIASYFDKSIFHPYLHAEVVRQASLLPLRQCIDGQSRKVVLRDVARLLGLDQVADRPKKAAQYGSGVMKVMKAEARRLGVELRSLVPALEGNEKMALLP